MALMSDLDKPEYQKIEFKCRGCGDAFDAPRSYNGRRISCNKCGEWQIVPGVGGGYGLPCPKASLPDDNKRNEGQHLIDELTDALDRRENIERPLPVILEMAVVWGLLCLTTIAVSAVTVAWQLFHGR